MAASWEFWIDVGGTFTDCIGRGPDGSLHAVKVLSSGVIKGRAAEFWAGNALVDPARAGVPLDFYRGYTLRLLDEAGRARGSAGVIASDSTGHITVDQPLASARPGAAYELVSGEPAPILAIRHLLGLRLDQRIGTVQVLLGTTRATNALLEGKGAAVAFVTTAGFADLLEIGTQARPHLFKLNIVKPPPLYCRSVELTERIDATGRVLVALAESDVEAVLAPLREKGITALAICLLNAYLNPVHERLAAEVARRLGFEQISISSDLSPTIKALDRGDTAAVDAYLSPVLRGYVADLRDRLPDASLKLMTSSGGLVEASGEIRGKDFLLSGPAGGVVGMAHAAAAAGFAKAIGFDMGGTSTDVSRFDGQFEYQFSGSKAGARIVAPMFAIETVAAGGGSICDFDGQKLTVGPHSAGADPGPACYGRGGPLTITDINLFNGKIDPAHFPFPLDEAAVGARLREIDERIAASGQACLGQRRLADGFTQLANLKMATAIKQVSTSKGYDPAEHALVSFGAAGAQHACAIARSLGIGSILLHPYAGLLSALGVGMADVRRFAEQTVNQTYSSETLATIDPSLSEMEQRLRAEVRCERIADSDISLTRLLDLRYRGEDSAITIRQPADGDYAAAFERAHQQLYGHAYSGRSIEIATMRSEAVGRRAKPWAPALVERPGCAALERHATVWFDGEPWHTNIYRRDRLCAGEPIEGPAVVLEPFSTIVIDPGWFGLLTESGDLLVSDNGGSGAEQGVRPSTDRDPIRLELFNNHFSHIATQMGLTLQRTALSVNVKERLDFSCAILDPAGDLLVNAPHIPVHLGAVGEAVKALLAGVGDIRPGDVYACNDPDLGGSHLPDITVMTPVFDATGQKLLFFTASRAHHAEIGGVRPGSMNPFAENLAQEGVVLRNLLIARAGHFIEPELRRALATGPYPSRAPDDNVADIRAAIAANHLGARELLKMIDQYSLPVVQAYMRHIRDAAGAKMRDALRKLGDRECDFEDAMDDGAAVRVRIKTHDGRITIDFAGSGPVNRATSLNANRAIVQSAVLYCLRCLIDEDIPLNAGVLSALDLIVPEGTFLNPPHETDPAHHAAVVGGNVEVSQRIVDVILGALGLAAASQGTMNNLAFGSERFGYYETLCGGVGAGPGCDGASAVHSHMTNTRLTDVEVLERRYPVLLRSFAVRRGSGGAGKHAGGDGVIRAIEFLAPLEVSLLTQRRRRAPFGLAGGEPGQFGRNMLERGCGSIGEDLGPLAQFTVSAGDVLTIETPGGGGWGCSAAGAGTC